MEVFTILHVPNLMDVCEKKRRSKRFSRGSCLEDNYNYTFPELINYVDV